MKTITVPGTDDTFTIMRSRHRGPVQWEVAVYDDSDREIATVAVYHDGDAEVVWQTPSDPYVGRSAGWWADVATEVARAVAP